MRKININSLITTSCNTGALIAQIGTVIACSSFVWWCVNPAQSNQLTNVAPYQVNTNIAQGVINQAPFGIIVKKTEVVNIPTIQEQVKVIGVYAAGVTNSIAFLTVETKNIIAKIGDKVLEGTITQILPNGVVINDGKQDVTIEISDSATPSGGGGNSSTTPSSSRRMGMEQNNDNNGNGSVNNTHTSDNNNNQSRDDLVSQRKKMIEQFQQQNSDNAPSNANNAESAH